MSIFAEGMSLGIGLPGCAELARVLGKDSWLTDLSEDLLCDMFALSFAPDSGVLGDPDYAKDDTADVCATAVCFPGCRCGLRRGNFLTPVPAQSCPRYDTRPWGVWAGFQVLGQTPGFKWPTQVKEPGATLRAPELPRSGGELRLRPRSRVTRSLEAVGRRVRGWWKDLPAESDAQLALLWMQEYSVDGTKLGMARSVSTCGDDGQVGSISLVEVHFSSEERPSGSGLFVCPELVAELFSIRCFRALDASTLQSLRGRARLWARDKGVSPLDLALFLPGTLVFAALPQWGEVEALGALRSSAAKWSVDVLGSLARGHLKAASGPSGFWASIKSVFGGHRDHILEPMSTRLALTQA